AQRLQFIYPKNWRWILMINVMIVEDDFRVANIHEAFIEKIEGFQIVEKVTTGSNALKEIENIEIDLIILDIFLPDLLGTTLIDELRKVKSDVDIIIVTAATEKKYLEIGLKHGVVDYLIKPLTMERFENALK